MKTVKSLDVGSVPSYSGGMKRNLVMRERHFLLESKSEIRKKEMQILEYALIIYFS